jgi:hypothetical protein
LVFIVLVMPQAGMILVDAQDHGHQMQHSLDHQQ